MGASNERCRNQTNTSVGTYLDNDGMGRKVDTPGKGCRAAENSDQTFRKVALHKVTVLSQHASMVDTKAIGKQLLQLFVTRPCDLRRVQKNIRFNSCILPITGLTENP